MKPKHPDKIKELNDFYKTIGIDPKDTPTVPQHNSPENFYKELKDFSIYTSEGFDFSTSNSASPSN